VREQLRNRANLDNFMHRLNSPQFKDLNGLDALITTAVQFRAFFFNLSIDQQKEFFTMWNDYYKIFIQMSPEERVVLTEPKVQSTKVSDNELKVLMLSGVPGSGKSNLAIGLKDILGGVHIEQDMFAGSTNPRNAYNAEIIKCANDTGCEFLILAKVNHTQKMRKEVRDILDKTGRPYRIVYIVFEQQSVDFYVDRINGRGMSHRTLHPSKETEGIIRRFLKEAREDTLTSEESSDAIVINPCLTREENLRQVVDFIKLRDFTDIDIDDMMIDKTIQDILHYEESNRDYALSMPITVTPKKSPAPLYDALLFSSLDVERMIFPLVETEHTRKTEFHTTITFYGKGKKPRTDLVFGETVLVKIIGYATDEKATALIVDKTGIGELQIQAEYPHISFALGDGVAPFYSNELVKKCTENNTVHLFDTPVELFGTITRF
jgi:hypothetical protein